MAGGRISKGLTECGSKSEEMIMVRILFFFLFMLLMPVWASAAVFTVTMKSSGEKTMCEQLRLADKMFTCRSNGALYQYAAADVGEVLLNKKSIYPYHGKGVSEIDLGVDSCAEIMNSIRGPLLLEKNEEVYFLIGRMYEEGICNKKSLEKASKYYLNAGKRGALADKRLLKTHPELIKRAELAQDYLDSLQKNADEKRRLHAIQDVQCQKECAIQGEVESKFRYNLQCYNDCMSLKE